MGGQSMDFSGAESGSAADLPVVDHAGRPGSTLSIASWTTIVSGVVATIGMVFLIAMFVAFAIEATGPALVLGRINDLAVLVSYLLCTPSVLAVHHLLRPSAPVAASLTTILGLGSIAAIVVLQALLVVGAMTFEEQVGLVSVALLGLAVWFVVTGRLGAAAGVLPHGLRMGILRRPTSATRSGLSGCGHASAHPRRPTGR